MLGKRKLGSTIGALALIGGFMGAAGVSVLTATSASADPPGSYSCTVTDPTLGLGHGTGLTCSADSAGRTITGVRPATRSTSLAPARLQRERRNHSGLWIGRIRQPGQSAGLRRPRRPISAAQRTGRDLQRRTSARHYIKARPQCHCSAESGGRKPGCSDQHRHGGRRGTQNPLIIVDVAFAGERRADDNDDQPVAVRGEPDASPLPSPSTPQRVTGGERRIRHGSASPIPNPTVSSTATPIGQFGTGGSSTLTVSPAPTRDPLRGHHGWHTKYPVMTGGVTFPAGLTVACTA